LREKQAGFEKTCAKIRMLENKPEMESMVGNLERKKKVLLFELSQMKEAIGGEPFSYFMNSFYALETTGGDDPEVLAIVDRTKGLIAEIGRKTAAKVAGSGAVMPPGYTGWKACAECHKESTANWQKTDHAEAFSTLVSRNQQYNFNCVPCHVTGIEDENVGQALSLSPELQGVGCEACHGPGQVHEESGGEKRLPGVSVKTCLRCHITEKDESFDFGMDTKKIKCGI